MDVAPAAALSRRLSPLLLGVQRFAASGGYASNLSSFQREVASSLGWSLGRFGLIDLLASAPHEQEATRRRRLEANSTGNATIDNVGGSSSPDELNALFDTLITLAVAIIVCVAVQAGAHLFWRHSANRRWYAEKVHGWPSTKSASISREASASRQHDEGGTSTSADEPSDGLMDDEAHDEADEPEASGAVSSAEAVQGTRRESAPRLELSRIPHNQNSEREERATTAEATKDRPTSARRLEHSRRERAHRRGPRSRR